MADAISTTLTPTKVGHLVISANPLIAGVSTAKADLFLTSLYVDIDGGFQPGAPEDETANFVPGSLANGSSIDPATVSGKGQPITLHVLTGPGSKGFVTFTIPSSGVTHWRGSAMNYPIGSTDDAPDMAFDGGAATVTIAFAASGDTFATLYVRDYAARGTIEVSVASGKKTYPVASRILPTDADEDMLPDEGWRLPGGTKIPSSGLSAEEDFDADPLTLPPPAEGLVGDGLTALEEYRGFVTAGQHRRLNPSKKDLFIVTDPEVLVSPVNAIAILTKLPMSLHYLDDDEAVMQESATDPAADRVKPVINPNRNGIAQAKDQRAIRIRERIAAPLYHRLVEGDYTPAEYVAAGYTWVDPEDLHTITEPSLYPLATPNGTQTVEYYPRAFENFAISYGANGIFESNLDKDGNPVVACADPVNDIWCVVLDAAHQIAYKPPKQLRLLAAAGGDDYYTNISLEGCDPSSPRRALTEGALAGNSRRHSETVSRRRAEDRQSRRADSRAGAA